MALTAAIFAATIAVIVALTRMAVQGANKRREAVALLLAFPAEAPRVWHQLPLAGVLVHAGP